MKLACFIDTLLTAFLSSTLLLGCSSAEAPIQSVTSPTHDRTLIPSFTPSYPTPTAKPPTGTPIPTLTLTSLPSPTRPQTKTAFPTIVATATLRPDNAPGLSHVEVRFIRHGNREKPWVALTFDMCQRPQDPTGFDVEIFQALEEKNAPATFFLGGDWMRTHIMETRLLVENPLFELGNHSWSHPDMRELNELEMSQEILRTQNMMYQITGCQSRLFRAPAGQYNDLLLSVVAWHGLYTIQWDVTTGDPVPDNTAENILKLILERVQNGSIVIMHGNGRGWHTGEAMPSIIDSLRDAGYQLVTISELIDFADPTWVCTP